jgi:hypothetical protein
MVDNTTLIKKFFFDNDILPQKGKEGKYVLCELIARSKDTNKPEFKVCSYTFNSLEDFDKKIDTIKSICAVTKARAYIYLTSIETKKIHLEMLKTLINYQENEYYDKVNSVFDSVCGKLSYKSKLWMVDVDTNDQNKLELIINNIQKYGGLVKLQIPSVNGYHLVITKFNIQPYYNDESVKNLCEVCEIKKSTPQVILYYQFD